MATSKSTFIDKVQVFAGKFSTQRHLVALRDGMAAAMTLIIVGSVFTLLANFPFEPYTNWIASIGVQSFFSKASDATFGIMGLAVTFATAYNLAGHYKINQLSAGLIALACFVLVTPVTAADEVLGAGFPTKYFSSSGLFVGIIVSLISTEICHIIIQRDLTIKMPDSVPPNVSAGFTAIVPALASVLFWLIVQGILSLFGVSNIHALISDSLQPLLSGLGTSLPGLIVFILIQCFFWMFGIHGYQVIAPVFEVLLIQNSDANRAALQAGEALPNIVTYEFFHNTVMLGGAGCLFALAILLFFRSKSQTNKALGKLSLAPDFFAVAEPIIFGFPIIMNPRMLIPFVLAPCATATIGYLSMAAGLVPYTLGTVLPWTTPPIIGGALATGSIAGGLLCVVNLVVATLIYLPFFKMDDMAKLAEEAQKADDDLDDIDLDTIEL